jgi:hypothetical protein
MSLRARDFSELGSTERLIAVYVLGQDVLLLRQLTSAFAAQADLSADVPALLLLTRTGHWQRTEQQPTSAAHYSLRMT